MTTTGRRAGDPVPSSSRSPDSPASKAKVRSASSSKTARSSRRGSAIFEAPRYFERLVRGRTPDEVLDIVARICGICPVAYQMSAVHAFEDAAGVVVDPAVRALRRLLYCGEWIESHALHVYFLHAPDFLGYPSAIELARDHRVARRAGAGPEEDGQPPRRARRRSPDPPGHRPRRRLLPRPDAFRDDGRSGLTLDRGARPSP